MSPRRVAKALALVGALALCAVIVVAVRVVRSRNHISAIKQVAGIVPGSLLHANNFHWTQMKDGRKQWELSAKEASYTEDKTAVKLKGARFSMVLDDGKKVLLRAPAVRLALKDQKVSRADLQGGIELNYGDIRLRTPSATFLPDQDYLTAAGEVQIEGEGASISGVGMEAHPRERLFSLQHQVDTRLFKRPPGDASKPS